MNNSFLKPTRVNVYALSIAIGTPLFLLGWYFHLSYLTAYGASLIALPGFSELIRTAKAHV